MYNNSSLSHYFYNRETFDQRFDCSHFCALARTDPADPGAADLGAETGSGGRLPVGGGGKGAEVKVGGRRFSLSSLLASACTSFGSDTDLPSPFGTSRAGLNGG